MDTFGVAARIRDFDQRNGGNPVLFQGFWWYRNGAYREDDPLGPMFDPPQDEHQRLAAIVHYYEGKLRQATLAFDELREQLLGSGSPQPEGLDQLKAKQAEVSKRNAELLQAKEALAATPEAQKRERWRLLDAENKQRLAEFKDQVKAIRV